MASVTSGLSAADSQNIIRATDALNRLTRSINSLEVTNRELVKSTIKFNTLFKSIDNLDRGLNRVRTSFVKAENRQTSQTIRQNKPLATKNIEQQEKYRPEQNVAANGIKQNPLDKSIYIDKRYLDKPNYSRDIKDAIDSLSTLAGGIGTDASVPIGLLSISAKRMIDDSDEKDEYERRKRAQDIDRYNNLQNHRSYDVPNVQRKTLDDAEKSLKNFAKQQDINNKLLKDEYTKRENLLSGEYYSDMEIPLLGRSAYINQANSDIIPIVDQKIADLIKANEDIEIHKREAQRVRDDVKYNFSTLFGIPDKFNISGVLAGESEDSNNTTNIQTSVTRFESGQYQYDSFHESSRSSRYGAVQVAADYKSSSDRKSSEFSSAQSIARDLTAKPKSAEDLINERTEQQFSDIESLNTYAKSTEDYRLYQEARVAIAAQASEARQSIRQNEEQMDRQATLSGLNDMNSAVTGLMGIAEAARGKQSGTYKALFAMSKAFNVAQATLNLQSAIVGAMNSPENVTVAQKFASMAAVASAGVQLLTSITSITMSGQAHAGIDYIPREGTWLLDRGERVVDSRTNADLKQYLSKSNGGSGGGSSVSVNVPLSIQSEGSGGSGVTAEDASILAGMIKSKVYEIVSNEQRPGGLLSRG